MTPPLQSNSGCIVEAVGRDLIVKVGRTTQIVARLLRQIEKQSQFSRSNTLTDIVVPTINEIRQVRQPGGKEDLSVTMQQIDGLDYISFLEHASFEEIADTVKTLIGLVRQSDALSRVNDVPFMVVEKKFYEVLVKIRHNSLVSDAFSESELVTCFERYRCRDITIPVGACHGDLTLTNMLFSSGKIALFDFLDAFIETPLQDMVSLRQDTHFRWAFRWYGNDYNELLVEEKLRYFDGLLQKHFLTYQYYRDYGQLFQFLKLLRILPYVTPVTKAATIEAVSQFLVTEQSNGM